MRILAIRGENLASLWGPFEVDLERPPIAGAGLFAICGPTGAGKSTLLDALCLALFGRTPRLDDRGGARIGRADEDERERVAANDARALLSRGASRGHAEVDFVGVDGRRYRARWTVRRARGRAGGKLQPQEMTLTDIATGAPLGDGLAATRAAIEDRLGFGFEEFRRAVVLPQFEFTAFLRAGPDDRGKILQRVTGTALYEALSVAAHERAAEERRLLAALDLEASLLPPLDPAARAALDAECATLRAAGAAAADALREAEGAVAWHARAGDLAAAVARAGEALAAAVAARAAAAPLRLALAEVEAAERHRAELDRAARAEEAVAARQAEEEARQGELAARERAEAEGGQDAAEAQRGRVAAEAAVDRLGPELARARALDAAVAAARQAEGAARRDDTTARAGAEEADRLLAAARRELARAEAEHREALEWIAAHASTEPLAQSWERYRADLGRHRDLSEALRRAQAKLGSAGEAEAAARRRADAAARRARAADEAADGAEEAARRAEAAAEAADPGGLAHERDRLAARAEGLRELARLAAAAAAAARARDEARERGDRSRDAAASARGRLAAAEVERRVASGARDEARDAERRARDALSLEGHRARLSPGEPCPLCGAREHPWAGRAPDGGLADELAARVAVLEAELLRWSEQAEAARVDAEVAERDAGRADEETARQGAALADAEARFAAASAGVDRDLPPRPRDAAPALEEAIARGQARLVELRRDEVEARRRVEAAAGARAEATRRRDEAARLGREIREAEAAAADAARLADVARAEQAGLARERAAVEDGLAPAFGGREGWRGRLRDDPDAFLAACEAEVRRHSERRAARDRLAERAGELRPELAQLAARADERRSAADRAARALAARQEELRARLADRAGLLGGRPADAVEAEARGAAREAARRAEAAGDVLERARIERARAASAADLARDAHAAALAEAAAAAAELSRALDGLGCDRAALERRLARGRPFVEAARAELAGLDRRVDASAGALAEVEAAAAAHASGRPGGSPEQAAARLDAARAAEGDAAERLAAARARLRDDDDRRARHAALAPRRASQERRTRTWSALDEVIGSASGSALRVFAQSLTLDALLAAANRHLAELAPRYRLARVPGTDLELQVVDDDLGSEVRSVNSLSGGEAFLASLALALGLASLSTRAASVETLFVDEGFGTLDRDTLDEAIVALEGLQARGRTVGVISHVPELQERLGVQVRVEPVGTGRSRVVAERRAG